MTIKWIYKVYLSKKTIFTWDISCVRQFHSQITCIAGLQTSYYLLIRFILSKGSNESVHSCFKEIVIVQTNKSFTNKRIKLLQIYAKVYPAWHTPRSNDQGGYNYTYAIQKFALMHTALEHHLCIPWIKRIPTVEDGNELGTQWKHGQLHNDNHPRQTIHWNILLLNFTLVHFLS